jgi:uncharacterized membrane protein
MQPTEFRTGVIQPIECAKEAWQIIKPDYWLLFLIILVGAVVGGVTAYILIGAMICGIMYCYLRRIDGYPVRFEDLWKGLRFFWPSLVVTIVFVIPIVIMLLISLFTIYLPIIAAAMMGERITGDELISLGGGAFLADTVIAVLMVCVHTLLTFSFPLIVDRGLSGFAPISVSAKAVLKNLGGIGGLIVVNFVLAMAGAMACGVGTYLILPLVMATSLVAYRKVFPAMTAPNLNPPPPNAYSLNE